MKKLSQKALSILLVAITSFLVFPSFCVVSHAQTPQNIPGNYTSTPSLNIWQADWYSAFFDSTFLIDESPSFSRTYYDALKDDSLFIAGLVNWNIICVFTNPADVDEVFTRRQYYDALLIELLTEQDKNSSFISDVQNNFSAIKKLLYNSYSKHFVSVSKKILGEEELTNDLDIDRILAMAPADYETLFIKEDKNTFAKKLVLGTKYSDSISMISDVFTIFEMSGTLYKAIDNVAKYFSLNEALDGTEAILDYIWRDTNNPLTLRNAAYDCMECFQSGFNGVLESFVNGFGNTIVDYAVDKIIEEVYDLAWEKLGELFPGAKAVLLAAKGTKLLMEYFGVDKVSEAFYNLEATVILEDALERCIAHLKNQYDDTKSEKAAVEYLRSIYFFEKMAQISFDSSINLLKAYTAGPFQSAAWADKVNLNTGETEEGKITKVNNLKKEIESFKARKIENFSKFGQKLMDTYIQVFCPDWEDIKNISNVYMPTPGSDEILLPTKQIDVKDLKYTKNNNNTVTINDYIGRPGKYQCVAIPSEIDGCPVVQIDPFAFCGESFYRIIIPNSVRSIGDQAFWGHMYLKSLVILGKNTTIGNRAFGWEIKSGGKVLINETANNTELYGEPNSTAQVFAENTDGFWFNNITNSNTPVWDIEPKDNIYHAYLTSDLKFVKNLISASDHLEGYTIKLEHNLYLSSEDWVPIGDTNERYFAGSFDGNGYTISTYNYQSTYRDVSGFFAYVRGANNFIGNFTLHSYMYMSENWVNSDAVGAVVGRLDVDASNFQLKNIKNRGSIYIYNAIGTVPVIGGLIGRITEKNDSKILIDNAYSTLSSISGNSVYENVTMGGMIGVVSGSSSDNNSLEIKNSYMNSSFSTSSKSYSEACVGGFIGRLSGVDVNIHDSASEGSMSLSAWKNYCGGLIGCLTANKKLQFEDCFVAVNPSGHAYAGIFDYSNTAKIDSTQSYIRNCIVTANASSYWDGYAAFAGYNEDGANKAIRIENCYYNRDLFGAPAMNYSIGGFLSFTKNYNNQFGVNALNSLDLKNRNNYTLDFVSKWDWCNFKYPSLKCLSIEMTSIVADSRIEMNIGETAVLSLSYLPMSSTSSISATSTNESIASISGNTISANSIGFCRINAVSDNGCSKSINFCCSTSSEYKYELIDDDSNEIRLISCTVASEQITLPDTIDGYVLRELGANCIKDTIQTVKLPSTVNVVSEQAFNSATDLKAIFVDEANDSFIGYNGILYSHDGRKLVRCPIASEENVLLMKSVTEYSAYSFYKCSTLEAVPIAESVESIGEYAFYDCDSLEKVIIPETILYIGKRAFNACDSLETVDFRAINCICEDDILLFSIRIGVFPTNVKQIVLGENVTRIPSCLFVNTAIEKIEIPYSVTEIDAYAFNRCNSLSQVVYASTEEAWTNVQIEGGNEPLLNAEISFLNIPIPHVHTFIASRIKEPSCETGGVMLYECDCGETYSEEITALGHIQSEIQLENIKDPTCETCGQYDEVVYCLSCKIELGRHTIITNKLNHVPGDVVFENVIEATYSSDGSKDEVVYCTLCSSELSRKPVSITKLTCAHNYQTNAIEATCTEEGKEINVCVTCGASYEKTIPALGHKDNDNDGKCDYCKNLMIGKSYCKYCGKIHDGLFGWLVKFFHSILAIFKR